MMVRRSDKDLEKLRKVVINIILSQKKKFSAYDITRLYWESIGVKHPGKELYKSEIDRADKITRQCILRLKTEKKIKFEGSEAGHAPIPRKLYRVSITGVKTYAQK